MSTYIAPSKDLFVTYTQHGPTSAIEHSFMESIVGALSSIPDTVWAAITASLLTLAGVVLSNRNSRKQLAIQIDRQEAETKRQRKSEIRRTVYLQLCEVLPRANILFVGLANEVLNQEYAQQVITDLGSVASKIQLIGESETSMLATKLSNEYGKLWIEAIVESREAQRFAMLEAQQQQILAQFQSIVSHKLHEFDTASGNDKEKISAELKAWNDEVQSQKCSLEEISNEKLRLKTSYIKWAVNRMEKPQNVGFELAAELRNELETGYDREKLIEIMKSNRDEIRTYMLKNLS